MRLVEGSIAVKELLTVNIVQLKRFTLTKIKRK